MVINIGSRQNRIFILYIFSLLILFLHSLYAWFLWGTQIFTIFFATGISILLYYTSKDFFNFKKSNFVLIILLIIVQIYAVKDGNTNALIATVLRIIIFSFLILLKDSIKIDLLHFFTKAFAILLVVSLFGWILFLFGVDLPNTIAKYGEAYGEDMYSFYNYYFFLIVNYMIDWPVPRFSGVFLEPSYLGMIATALIIANRFDFKKKSVWIFLIATLLSFSLSAYVALLITLIAFLLIESKRPVINLFFFILMIYFVSDYYKNLNSGENAINNYIFKRLEWVDGKLVGDNRYSENFQDYYTRLLNSDKRYFGVGYAEYSSFAGAGNAGYKVYIVLYGIVGLLLILLFYLSILFYNYSKSGGILFMGYVLIFIIASYPLMDCQLMIFITAIPGLKCVNQKLENVLQEKT